MTQENGRNDALQKQFDKCYVYLNQVLDENGERLEHVSWKFTDLDNVQP